MQVLEINKLKICQCPDIYLSSKDEKLSVDKWAWEDEGNKTQREKKKGDGEQNRKMETHAESQRDE